MKIAISRSGVPATHLYTKIVSQGDAADIGTTKPVAFILPGGPGASMDLYMKYTCLQEVADLVFHDPRGCGNSDKGSPDSYTMDNYIEDVEAIRQYLALDKITVIGKSYGSMCALGYTIRYPQYVEKLVLASGAPSYRFLDKAKQTIREIGTPQQIKICEKAWHGDFNSVEELLEFFKLTNPLYSVKARTHPENFDLNKKTKIFSYEVLNQGFRQAFWHFDYENDMQQITCPTLVLAGREDWINSADYAVFMAEKIPNSQLIVFEHASHAMETDVEQEYFQSIADFIA